MKAGVLWKAPGRARRPRQSVLIMELGNGGVRENVYRVTEGLLEGFKKVIKKPTPSVFFHIYW
jgi:hypothetical protein